MVSELFIKWDKIKGASNHFDDISKELSRCADIVTNVTESLEISESTKNLLKKDLRKRAENITQLSSKSMTFGKVLSDISDKYKSTENKLAESWPNDFVSE